MKDKSLIYLAVCVVVGFIIFWAVSDEMENIADQNYSQGYHDGYKEAMNHADSYIYDNYGEVYVEKDGYLTVEYPEIPWPDWID